jgi:hypothetical protein
VAPRAPVSSDMLRALHDRPFFGSAPFQKPVWKLPGAIHERAGFPASSLLAEHLDMRFPAPTQCRIVWVAPLLSATCRCGIGVPMISPDPPPSVPQRPYRALWWRRMISVAPNKGLVSWLMYRSLSLYPCSGRVRTQGNRASSTDAKRAGRLSDRKCGWRLRTIHGPIGQTLSAERKSHGRRARMAMSLTAVRRALVQGL